MHAVCQTALHRSADLNILLLWQAACTPKELREILGLAGKNVQFNTGIPPVSKGSQGGGTADRIKRRLHDIFSKAAAAADPEWAVALDYTVPMLELQFWTCPNPLTSR